MGQLNYYIYFMFNVFNLMARLTTNKSFMQHVFYNCALVNLTRMNIFLNLNKPFCLAVEYTQTSYNIACVCVCVCINCVSMNEIVGMINNSFFVSITCTIKIV